MRAVSAIARLVRMRAVSAHAGERAWMRAITTIAWFGRMTVAASAPILPGVMASGLDGVGEILIGQDASDEERKKKEKRNPAHCDRVSLVLSKGAIFLRCF